MDGEQIEQLHRRLEEAVAALGEDAAWRAFLRGAATFHTYSWTNSLLIWVQCPEASAVKGFRAWQSLGRQVRKGEKAIRIMAPRPYTKTIERDGTEVEERRLAFTWTSVFDISQTDPIPGHPSPWERPTLPDVQGDAAAAQAVYAALEAFLVERGVRVTREATGPASAKGWYDPARNRINVVPADPATEAVVLLHEAAHALAHGVVDGYACNEVIAQAASYIAATSVGIEAEAFSAAYVAGWLQRDPAGFRTGMATTVRIAGDLIAVVQGAGAVPAPAAA